MVPGHRQVEWSHRRLRRACAWRSWTARDDAVGSRGVGWLRCGIHEFVVQVAVHIYEGASVLDVVASEGLNHCVKCRAEGRRTELHILLVCEDRAASNLRCASGVEEPL